METNSILEFSSIENFTNEQEFFNLRIEKKGNQWKDLNNKCEMAKRHAKADIESSSQI